MKLQSILKDLELIEHESANMLTGGFLILESSSSVMGGAITNTNCAGCTNNCDGGNCIAGCGKTSSPSGGGRR